MASKSVLQKVLDLTAEFVMAQKGVWSHEEWEGFLAKATALGVELTDESKRNLGNILEASRCFYSEAGTCACKSPKPAAKPRAKAKPKVK